MVDKLELSKEQFEEVFFAACRVQSLSNTTIMFDAEYAQALVRQWRSEYLGNKDVLGWVQYIRASAGSLFDALIEDGAEGGTG